MLKRRHPRLTSLCPQMQMPYSTSLVRLTAIYESDEAFHILESAFPGYAEDTYVYEYLHRLYNTDREKTVAGPAPVSGPGSGERVPAGSRHAAPAASVRIPSIPSSRQPAQPHSQHERHQQEHNQLSPSSSSPSPLPVPAAPIDDPLDAQLRSLVKSASSASVTSSQAIPDLYSFLKQHPGRQDSYERMINDAVGSTSSYKRYIKRKLDALAAAEVESETAGVTGGTATTVKTEVSERVATLVNSTSTGHEEPGQSPNFNGANNASTSTSASASAPASASASASAPTASSSITSPIIDTDTRLEMLKNKFQYFAQARTNAQQQQ